MGVGKSTIGKHVAAKLGLPFYDTDRLVTQQSQQTIAEIFRNKGESAFRQYEADALRSLLGAEDIIVALGGGTLHHHNNFEVVKDNFVLVILDASFAFLKSRLENRPLRATADALYRERRNLFATVKQVVNVEQRSIDEITSECIQLWKAAA